MNSHPSVVIFGTSISSAYLSGCTILFRALTDAFVRLGWQVKFVEEQHAWLELRSDYHVASPLIQVLCYGDRPSLVKLLNDPGLFDDVQLVLKFSGSSYQHDRHIDEWLADAKCSNRLNAVIVYVDADAPMRLPYIIRHPHFYLHKVLCYFDGVWVMLGGRRAIEEYRMIGAQRVWFMPAAVDPQAFQPMPSIAEYAADLLFIGNPAYGRTSQLKRLFFDVAEQCPANRFLLAGAEWGSACLPRNVHYLGYVPSNHLPQLYSSARLILNITREEMAVYGHAGALRLFEAASCGGCIVTDMWSGIDTLFGAGKEILVAENTADIVGYVENVDWQLSKTIGNLARARVFRDHTPDHRIRSLLKILNLN